VLVEGGAEILQSVLRARLCHQIVLTIKPLFFGGYRSMTGQLDSPSGLADVSVHQVENDFLMYGRFISES
jgi:riboflavin biosynthesis pyrimidine reductase